MLSDFVLLRDTDLSRIYVINPIPVENRVVGNFVLHHCYLQYKSVDVVP